MTSRDFAYWLQGHFEINDSDILTERQVKMIKRHLALVFKHEIDPSFGDEKVQQKLNLIHAGDTHPSNQVVSNPPEQILYRC